MSAKEKRVSVKVPASTSNLGAGFDCIGMAVDRWLTASVEVSSQDGPSQVMMTRSGAVANLGETAEEDLIHTGFKMACETRGRRLPTRLHYVVTSTIPAARGLGSSAAALIAGAMLANDALSLDLDREAVASLCARVEGHPDNAGAAVFGGTVLSIESRAAANKSGYFFSRLQIHPHLGFVFAVPDLEIETSAARAVLPSALSYAATVAAIAKAASLVRGLSTGEADLLAYALDDVVHVPFRRELIPGYASVVAAAVSAGAYGATLSGSGSAIVAVARRDRLTEVGSVMQHEWQRLGRVTDVILATSEVSGASTTAAG